jgi:hypothetical protein
MISVKRCTAEIPNLTAEKIEFSFIYLSLLLEERIMSFVKAGGRYARANKERGKAPN